MREYECLYIVSPQLADEDYEPLAERFRQLITDHDGEVLSVNHWGKRRLAYEINHSREGYYIQVRFNGDGDVSNELARALRLSEDVMRHIIVRAEDLDPEATHTVPEQLPEPTFEDRGRPFGDRRPRAEGEGVAQPSDAEAEAASEEAQSEEPPAEAQTDAAAEEQVAEEAPPSADEEPVSEGAEAAPESEMETSPADEAPPQESVASEEEQEDQ